MIMRALWIKVFLVSFGLQVVLPDKQFKFGDMLAFDRWIINHKPTFIHWAVYVGEGNVTGLYGKQEKQNIFHITGPAFPKLSNCVFGKVRNNDRVRVDNYLDNRTGYQFHNDDEMIKDINNLYQKCDAWKPRANNCEHIATLIRYGIEHCEQTGARAAKIIARFEENKKKRVEEQIRKKAGKRSVSPRLDYSRVAAAA